MESIETYLKASKTVSFMPKKVLNENDQQKHFSTYPWRTLHILQGLFYSMKINRETFFFQFLKFFISNVLRIYN